MLTDTALRNLEPKSKVDKASDRDAISVTVSPDAKKAVTQSKPSRWRSSARSAA
jgi:hypothetical protein